MPPHVEIYSGSRMFRPKITGLRWGSSFSVDGAGFGYCMFSIKRDVGKAYSDIGYGMRVKVRKGLTKILFDGVVTKISEKKEGGGEFEIGCVGWKIVFENERIKRIYADTRLSNDVWSVSETALGLYQPGKFDVRLGDVLRLQPRTKVDFEINEYAEAVYTGEQDIAWVQISIKSYFPESFPYLFQVLDESDVVLFALNGTGAYTNTFLLSMSGRALKARLSITLAGESTAADDPDTEAEEGAYIEITTISIVTKSEYPEVDANVSMSVIMRDLVYYLFGNGHGISRDISQIAAISRVLYPAVFVDYQTPREVLQWCAENGDADGNTIVWGIELNDKRRAFVRVKDLETVKYYLPSGESRTTVSGDTQGSAQKMIAVYSDGSKQFVLPQAVDQAVIDDMGGYYRSDVLKLDGVFSETLAQGALALALDDRSKPVVSSNWEISGSLLSHTGKRVPYDEIQPGGLVVDRNFRANEAVTQAGDFRDGVTTFYLVGVECDYASGVSRLIPDSDQTSLERYLDKIAQLTRA